VEGLERRAPLSGALTRIPVPAPTSASVDVGSLVSGPDGSVWFLKNVTNADSTTSTSVDRITHDGRISTVASLPLTSGIDDLTDGPGDSVWFAGNRGSDGVVGPVTVSGVITQIVIPITGYVGNITAGGPSNVWFTATNERNAPFVGRFTPGGHVIEYALRSPLYRQR
jgi:hypothetical protein